MQFSKPQIAWAIVWGVLFALFLVMWVRSYHTGSNFSAAFGRSRALTLISQRGFVGILAFDPNNSAPSSHAWGLSSFDPERVERPNWDFGIKTQSDRYLQMMMPWWFVLLAVATAVGAMKLKWQFSLRSLIVVITLVAIMLGTAVSVGF